MPRPADFGFLLSTLLLSVLYSEHAESRKLFGDNFFPSPVGCLNCSLCEYPYCQPLAPPPPPLPKYPIYGATPPPPISQYPPYGTAPPQANCTQFPSMYPPPYFYQPVGESYSVCASSFSLVSVMLLAVCISVLL